MEIWVRSGGFPESKGYTWVGSGDGERPSRGNPLAQYGISVPFDEWEPSLLIARRGGETLLLVRLDPGPRTDYRGRPIRTTVVWVGADHEQPALLNLAADALVRPVEFRARVTTGVTRDDAAPTGFKVDWVSLLGSGDLAASQGTGPRIENLIAANDAARRNDLGRELAAGCLPKQDGILVVVTEFAGHDDLAAANVWRSLSSRVALAGWQPLVKPRSGQPTAALTQAKDGWKKAVTLGAGVAVAATAATALLNPSGDPDTSPRVAVIEFRLSDNDSVAAWEPSRGSPVVMPRSSSQLTCRVVFDRPMQVRGLLPIQVRGPGCQVLPAAWAEDRRSLTVVLNISAGNHASAAVVGAAGMTALPGPMSLRIRVEGVVDRQNRPVEPVEVEVRLPRAGPA